MEQPFKSWVFDEQAQIWVPPVERPTDGGPYIWHEETASWRLIYEINS